MVINGVEKEIDQGTGTAAMTINDRTIIMEAIHKHCQ